MADVALQVHTCVPEGEEPPFPAADCEACRGDLRLLQNQAPLAGNRDLGDFRVASDDYALWADFTKLELKVVLVTLAALPVKYRKVFVDRRTFETMAATVFRELGLQWARSPWMKDEGAKKTVGFSAIELVTQANVNSKVVKGSLIQEKFRTNSAWFIWDMEDRAWFRCWTTTPPWSSCIQLEVQTLIESEVVQKYEGRVGGVFRKPGIFDAFVNHFERMEVSFFFTFFFACSTVATCSLAHDACRRKNFNLSSVKDVGLRGPPSAGPNVV